MKKLKFISVLFMLLSVLTVQSCSLFSAKGSVRKVERRMSGPSRKSGKVRESKKVKVAKAKQEKNQSRLKNDYNKSVKASRQRTYDIQTDNVKARMKNNEAQIAKREKKKDRMKKSSNRNAGRKYR
ncbi:MAG TPA: hypothetical protein VK213_05075 [Bacteroidales bacterium]|nr:hypothetical protein [Bacteroidales bacterium]